jgi:hypothetical protein
MRQMKMDRLIYRQQSERIDRVLVASPQKLIPVRETTMYPAQFSILLRERMQGRTVAETAEFLGIPPEQVNRLLAGHWRPTKGIREKMGLKVVYALKESPSRGIA